MKDRKYYTFVKYYAERIDNKICAWLVHPNGNILVLDKSKGNSKSVPKWLKYLSYDGKICAVPYFRGINGSEYFYKNRKKIDELFKPNEQLNKDYNE